MIANACQWAACLLPRPHLPTLSRHPQLHQLTARTTIKVQKQLTHPRASMTMPAAASYRRISHNLYFLTHAIRSHDDVREKSHGKISARESHSRSHFLAHTRTGDMAGSFAALQVQVDVYGILFFCVSSILFTGLQQHATSWWALPFSHTCCARPHRCSGRVAADRVAPLAFSNTHKNWLFRINIPMLWACEL